MKEWAPRWRAGSQWNFRTLRETYTFAFNPKQLTWTRIKQVWWNALDIQDILGYHGCYGYAYGYLGMYVDTRDIPWISIEIHGHPWISMDATSIHIHWYTMDSHWYPRRAMSCPWAPSEKVVDLMKKCAPSISKRI